MPVFALLAPGIASAWSARAQGRRTSRSVSSASCGNLDLEEPSGPGRRAHASAASGVVRRGDFVHVIGDDEFYLGVFPPLVTRARPSRRITDRLVIAAVSAAGSAWVWELGRNALAAAPADRVGSVTAVAVGGGASGGGPSIVLGGSDGTVCAWDLTTRRSCRLSLGSEIHDVAVAGHTVLVAAEAGLTAIVLSALAAD